MTPNQKKAIQYLNKIKEQWWNTRDGQTNLPEEWYMTILDAIVDYRPIRREDVEFGDGEVYEFELKKVYNKNQLDKTTL